jgi:soluble lytic murein transglycosylase-like protein
MHQKFPQSSTVLRVFALILACLFSAGAVMAQDKSANVEPSALPQATDTVGTPGAGETTRPSTDSGALKTTTEILATTSTLPTKSTDSTTPGASNASSDYKKILNDLQALYEREVQKLELQNSQLKGLYRDGLIARVEMEESDKDLAAARAKVEVARNQIAAANKPAPILPDAAADFVATEAAWSTGNNRVDTLVRYYGNRYGVDPYLIFCLMHQESRFTSNATSPKGAQGLMQLMPGTAARYGVTNPYDLGQSIMGGTRYLKDLLQMFNGRIDLALAGYNAGENAVIKHGYTVPPYDETRNYVRLIIARYAKKRTAATATSAL